jgi:hypothetical protein
MRKQSPIRCTLFRAVVSSLLLAAASSVTVALAQSESDLKTIDKARALYMTGPIPGSIACNLAPDWDAFFAQMNVAPTEDAKASMDKLRAIKMYITSRGADDTELKVDNVPSDAGPLGDSFRQQLQGFFQLYWNEAYGGILPKRGGTFELVTMPSGYQVKQTSGATKISIDMDKAYLVTSFSVLSPESTTVQKPNFKPGGDGLLRLSGLDQTTDIGSTKVVVSVGIDYQRVNGYDIPQHMKVTAPGSGTFDWIMTGCQVTGDNTAPPAAAK